MLPARPVLAVCWYPPAHDVTSQHVDDEGHIPALPAGDIRRVADLLPVEHLDMKPPVGQVRQAWCVGIFGSDMERVQRLWARVAARHGADTLKDQPPKLAE